MSGETCSPFVLHGKDELLLPEAFSILQFQVSKMGDRNLLVRAEEESEDLLACCFKKK